MTSHDIPSLADWLREHYPDVAEEYADDVSTADEYAADVSFAPAEIDDHFAGADEDYPEYAIWRRLDAQQRHDAALTIKGFFDNTDVVWNLFSELVDAGIRTYAQEQLDHADQVDNA